MKAESFQEHANRQLAHIAMTEGMKRRVRQRMKAGARGLSQPRRTLLRLALIALISLASLTAFALSRGMGLYELMGTVLPRFAQVRPEAEDLIQRDLAHYSFEHVDVAVREAAYDGRYLRVAYSVTDRAATAPLDVPGTSLTSDREGLFRFDAARVDGIWWETMDFALVNGEDVNPLGMTFSVAGENNGEAISWVQFDVRHLKLPDSFPVLLPFRGFDTPPELEFTMEKGDMKDVFRLQPPPDKRVDNYVIRVKDIVVSPIRTYITLHLIIDPGLSPEAVWKIANPWNSERCTLSDADGSKPQAMSDSGAGPCGNMEWVTISKPNGDCVFEDRITDPGQPVTMQVTLEYPPPREYPDAFRLGYDEKNFILIPFIKLDEP